MNETQALSDDGQLYGYRDQKWAAHLRDHHATISVWMTMQAGAAFHLALHELGADHAHYYTETGALSLTVKRDRQRLASQFSTVYRQMDALKEAICGDRHHIEKYDEVLWTITQLETMLDG